MSEACQRNPIEEVAEAFLARYRSGERPSITEYVAKHPELAEEIRELFPALVIMEEIGAEEAASPSKATSSVTPDGGRLKQIADYRIICEIGRGGMGVVYEAEQESLGRHVALKVLPHWAVRDALCLERFRREARSAARLHHTNIVPVYEVGEAQGVHYYAMQFIQGQSLDEIWITLRRMRKERNRRPVADGTPKAAEGDITLRLADGLATGRFTADDFSFDINAEKHEAEAGNDNSQVQAGMVSGRRDGRQESACEAKLKDKSSELSDPSHAHYHRSVARVGLQVAEALAYAHAQKVLHRDIKPSNLLLDLQGTVWVTDFGLAKEEGTELTQTGDLVGTLRYMAPERFSGRCDARSDVYSLGLTLYELLMLEPAFTESDRGRLVWEITSTEPPTLRSGDRQVPRDLETIVLKAIAKEPHRRYPSADGLAEDLRRFLSDRPILARRTSPGEHFWRWCRRNPAVAGMSAGLLAIALFVLIGSVLTALRLSRAAEQARRAGRDGEEQLFDSLLLQVNASRTSQEPGQRLESLKALARAADLGRALKRGPGDMLKLRNAAIACLALPDLELEADWEGNRPGTNGLGFDAAFERYAWSFEAEGIRICRLANHAEELRLPTPPSDRVSRWVLLGFSPDGRYLAAYYVQWADKHPLEIWEINGNSGRQVCVLPDASALPSFAADSGSLVAPLPNGDVAVIELPSGQERRRFSSGGPAETVAMHAGGKLLAVAGGRSTGARVIELETGTVIHRLPHSDTVQGLAWSPDGTLLATACNDLRIRLWDTVSWKQNGEITGHRWEVGDVAFDPTGRWLASFGWDMTLRFWEVGSRRQVLNVEDIRVFGFRSQGSLAAAGVSGQRVQVWAFRPSEVFQELHPFSNVHPATQFSPDGRWLATTAWDEGDFRIWDMATYREVHRQSGQRGGWSRDSSWILVQSAEGFSRVPVRASRSSGERPGFSFGQPRSLAGLHEDVRNCRIQWVGNDGRRLFLIDPPDARTHRTRVRLLELDEDVIQVRWEDWKPNANSIAASRDGRLVAVASYGGGSGISIWEAETGRLVRELPIGDAYIAFAADGSRLYTTTGRLSPRGPECRSWRVSSWEPDHALTLKRTSHSPAHLSTAADGSVAVTFTMNDVRILNPDSLEELATLSAPHPGLLQGVIFSPDATKLESSASGTVHLWDLLRLRQELAQFGLDWDGPVSPP
jgi:serine/threonine protein kinase/WD40 repeat protein